MIFAILAVLLRALVAPLLLIASVVVSFLGTLGLSIAFFIHVIGDTGVDNSLPTYAFIFLVALGIDYTIFLMSRVREEAREHGTREGTLRALAATGPVITSAGIILAGTFAVLLTLPVTFIFDLGFMVAIGILLDTFIVRTIMVPALVELVGDRCGGRRPRAADQYFSSELPRRCALSRSQSRWSREVTLRTLLLAFAAGAASSSLTADAPPANMPVASTAESAVRVQRLSRGRAGGSGCSSTRYSTSSKRSGPTRGSYSFNAGAPAHRRRSWRAHTPPT